MPAQRMNGNMTTAMTIAAATISPTARSHARENSLERRHDPNVSSPTSGTVASMTAI